MRVLYLLRSLVGTLVLRLGLFVRLLLGGLGTTAATRTGILLLRRLGGLGRRGLGLGLFRTRVGCGRVGCGLPCRSRLALGQKRCGGSRCGTLGLDVGLGLAAATVRTQGGIDGGNGREHLGRQALGHRRLGGCRLGRRLLARTAPARLGRGLGCGIAVRCEDLGRGILLLALTADHLRLRHLGERSRLGDLRAHLGRGLLRLLDLLARAAATGLGGLFGGRRIVRRRLGLAAAALRLGRLLIGSPRLGSARPRSRCGLGRRTRLLARGLRRSRSGSRPGIRRSGKLNRQCFVLLVCHYACSTTFFQSASKEARP